MARTKFRFNKYKGVISLVLVGLLLIGLVVGLSSLANKETKSISASEFSVGAINSNGIYVKSDTSIYTKNLIECQGLRIAPDFEAIGTFQVFYYGEDMNFIGATETLNANDGVYTKGDTFAFAKYCRIMITPDTSSEDNSSVEKIRFYEVRGYANDYTITVNKNQNTLNLKNLENYSSKFAVKEDTIYVIGDENHPVCQDEIGMSTTTVTTAVVASEKIGLVFDKIPSKCSYIVATASNNVISTGTLNIFDSGYSVFTMPSGGYILILNFDNGCAPAVYNAE